MQFIIDDSPDTTKWPSGTLLTLSETAQLLELDTAELLTRTRPAMVLREQGFSFHIQRQGQTRADETDLDRSLYDPEKENDVAYSRLMNQLDEVHMALEQLEDRLLEICRVDDREMATTDRMKRELATLEKLCRERWQF